MSSESRIWEIRPFGSMRGGRELVIGLGPFIPTAPAYSTKRSGSRLGGFEARRRITRRVSAPVVSRTNFLSSFSSLPFVRANGRFQGQSSNCAIRVTPRTSRQALQERVWPSLGPVHPAAGPNAPCQRHGDGRALPDH